MPEELTTQASPGSSPQTAPGAPGASPSPAPSTDTSGGLAPGSAAPAAPSPAGPAGTPGTPASPPAPDYQTVRDTLKNYGLADLAGQFQDDHSLLQHLAGIYQQRQSQAQLAQWGQQYLQHADQFQTWMRQKQEEARAQQAQSQAWWKAPEYDPSWASKLTRDPATGEVKVLPGNDPGLVQKYLAWATHVQQFQEKFSQDPIKAIQPGLEQLIDQRAQQMIQQHLGGYREQTQAQQLVSQHAAWIYERDAQGQPVQGAQGQPVLNEWGRRYGGYVQEAERMGIRGVQAQDHYALGLVQRDFLAARHAQQSQTQTQQAQGEQAKQDFLLRAGGGGTHMPQAGANGANGVNGAPNSPPPARGVRALQDLMLQNMKAAGFQPGQELAVNPGG